MKKRQSAKARATPRKVAKKKAAARSGAKAAAARSTAAKPSAARRLSAQPASARKPGGRKGSSARKPAATAPDSRPTPVDALMQRPSTVPAPDDALFPRLIDPGTATADALARLRTLETLNDAYDAWVELRALFAQAAAQFKAERARIEEQGAFLLGAVRAARDLGQPAAPPTGTGLATSGAAVDGFIADTSRRLDAARAQLDAAVRSAEVGWAAALVEARGTVRSRVERTLAHARPALRLFLRALPNNRRILHLERLTGDAPVLVHEVLSGAVPSRYGFLFDDSTEDVALAPAMLYPEEGVAVPDVRCPPARLFGLLAQHEGVFPSKGMVPMRVAQPAAPMLARFLQRGPVAEAEVADGEVWRSVLSVEEAEVIAGWLIKLQLEGRLSVTLSRG